MTLLEWPGGSWEATTTMVVAVFAAYVAFLWMALVFWTVRDIHQRTRDTAPQVISGLLVLFFFLPGHWLYLILRPRLTLAERYERTLEAEAVLQELSDRSACPRCGKRVKDDFVHCPSCRARLKRTCTTCQRPMDFAWVICPSCATEPRKRAVAVAAPQAETPVKPKAPEKAPQRVTVSVEDVQPRWPAQRKAGPSAKQRRDMAGALSSNGNGHANGNSDSNGHIALSNGHLQDGAETYGPSQEFPNGPDVGH